jgi:hypothetical protein
MFYMDEIYFKNKKNTYFNIYIYIYIVVYDIFFLIYFYSISFMCVYISIVVWLNKNLILINKFSKYNRVNILCCGIKYLDLLLSLDFFNFAFNYC